VALEQALERRQGLERTPVRQGGLAVAGEFSAQGGGDDLPGLDFAAPGQGGDRSLLGRIERGAADGGTTTAPAGLARPGSCASPRPSR
jgi:hypothetical protein